MKCEVCGKEIDKYLYSDAALCSWECEHTNYWREKLENENSIIINGVCYYNGGANDNGCLGFGGKYYKIKMNDGRIIETCNLWYNGKIPEEMNAKDNAEFI